MHQRAADTFRAGRVLLAGDAAHVTNPIGGLGLTGGFLDAFALAPALAAVVRGEAPEDVLTDYARERRRVFWEYVSPMATSNKQLVFHLDDKARAAAMAGIRMMAATPEMRAAQLLGMSAMVTPPLLDQRSSCKEGLPTYPLPRHAVERWWVGGEPVDGPLGTVMRGQMYIETLHPAESDRRADRPPIVLVHGGGGQGLDWLVTPDGRPGWAPLLADQGWTVHVVDRPGHGRSPLSPEVLGTPMPPMGAEALSPIFLPPVAGPDSHPGAALHTQWPGGRSPGDPVFDQFLSGQGPMPADMEVAQRLEQAALAALLDRIGPAVMITHSAGGPAGWLAADERPEQVLALVAIEVLGPPFLDRPDHGLRLPWGLTSAPLTLDPPVDDPAILHEGVHQLVNLTGIPIVLVAAEASPMRWIQPMIANFLAQHGCTVEQLRLWEHGVHGNGHAMMLERNHRAVLKAVMARVQDILEARGAANERTTASMLNT
jgi:pimeloyl-ACP methyl ester carboxylesterase